MTMIMEVTGTGRRRMQLLDNLRNRRQLELKEKVICLSYEHKEKI